MQRVMLYFGSFNPIHRGHIGLAEHVLDAGLCDLVTLVVSPQSPYKTSAELAPELDRFEMAELACAASRYPERIQPSIVELLLPKPSYTIETLRYLEQTCGERMQFSILMGGDQLAGLSGWREAEAVLRYPIWVYPRRGQTETLPAGNIRLLEDAPLFDLSATEVRRAVAAGEATDHLLDPQVAAYIRQKGLYR